MNFFTIVFCLLLGPRLVLLWSALWSDWYNAFESGWLAFLAWVFLPWTSLAWMCIYFNNDGQITGGYLILFIISIILDLGSNSSSGGTKIVIRRGG